MTRQVTEDDIRLPEFRGAKLEDLEFRSDGVVVRRDRWETAIHKLAHVTGAINQQGEFEINDVVDRVQRLFSTCETFIVHHGISCSKVIYHQKKARVEQNALPLIQQICDIVGYYEPEEE